MEEGKLISSKIGTFLTKFFTKLWFVLPILFIIIAITGGSYKENIMFMIVPIFMAAFGYLFFKVMFKNVVEKTYDHGDYLVFENKGEQEKVKLENIINISYSNLQNPPSAKLTLRENTKFGKEVAFFPKTKPFNFFENEIITDLIKRIDEARTKP